MTLPEEIACKELVEVIIEYFEGTMRARDRLRFEAHLALCNACVVYLDQMRQTVTALGRLSAASIPNERRAAELVDLFRDWKRESRS